MSNDISRTLVLASILKKTVMALTGLAWVGFVIGHLSGNLLLFRGPKPFNAYAEFLESLGGLLYLAEMGLIIFLLLHIYSGVRVSLENRRARPSRYRLYASGGKASLASRTMLLGGITLAVFIVTHIKMFKFSDHGGALGLWGVVAEAFSQPLVVAWYCLAMIALGLHLSHGFSSAFQTLGILKPAWQKGLKTAGLAFGWAIAGGFISMPLGFFFFDWK